jgi:protease I
MMMASVKPRLNGKRIALLSTNGLHEHEFWTPYYRLKEEAATLIVAGPEKGKTYRGEGIHGLDGLLLAPTDAAIAELNAAELDALVIPGGIYGPLELRDHAPTLNLVRQLDVKKKVIAAICHGPWVLVSAGVLRGRRATCPTDMADDVRNCGAEWLKQDVVRDGHIITGVYFGALPEFLRTVIDAIEG